MALSVLQAYVLLPCHQSLAIGPPEFARSGPQREETT